MALFFMRKTEEPTGVAVLEAMESGDVYEAQSQIEALRKQRRQESADAELARVGISDFNYQELFSNTVVVGDSIASGMSGYGYLSDSQVVAETGISMSASQPYFETAQGLYPTYLYIAFGANDVAADRYDQDLFREDFVEMMDMVVEMFPNAEIYVNSIFPSTTPRTTNQPWFEWDNLKLYNEVMEEVCADYGVTFLDNTDIVEEEYYEPDGLHFSRAFYPYWLYNMAKGAGFFS